MKDNDTKFELIEKYFEGRLTTTEKATFDRLLANNQEFAQDVSDYRKITAFTDFLDDKVLLKDIDTNRQTNTSQPASEYQLKAQAPVDPKGKRAIIKPVFLQQRINHRYAAAIILFLVGTVVVSLMLSHLDSESLTADVKKRPKSLQVNHNVALGEKIIVKPKGNGLATKPKAIKEKPSDYLAANFEVNETLERHIDKYSRAVQTRSANETTLFEIVNPQKKVDKALNIEWKSSDASVKNIVVKIFNNRNKQVLDTYNFPGNSGKTKLNTTQLPQGLYYWRVIDEESEKVLFTGKFTKGGK
ncbi:MAG TPA: hypothetical protein DCS93_09255 [Microscillaceae bacterium]|nr:hypothetical protein [Microscillaceae bacterium]